MISATITAVLLGAAGCGSQSADHSSSSDTASAAATDTSGCGSKPGVKATGTPIVLGAIVTKQPGVDFTDVTNMTQAYFECVNDNGGVNGHPIKYFVETEQSNPAQIAAAAHKLVETDHVMGIVGGISILECTINHAYWEKLGYRTINAGIAPECYSTPNSAAVNMGSRFSSDGAVQYALTQGVDKVVFDMSNIPGTGYTFEGVKAVAAGKDTSITTLTENVPITDANSVALRLVQAAGRNGAVVLNFAPPDDLSILKAAEKLGVANNVKLWGCSTPCNTDFIAKSLGSKWNKKLFINSELTPINSTDSSTMGLYKAVLSKYGSAVAGGLGSFSQMGFTQAEIAVHALESVQGDYTPESVNTAIGSVKDFDTGMLCEPWTYGTFPMHLPNNTDYTTTPVDGKLIQAQGCVPISSSDPLIAAYHKLAG
jgi:branched-chain amino acid transport system substrate-binding protein